MNHSKFVIKTSLVPPSSMMNHDPEKYQLSALYNMSVIDSLVPIKPHSKILEVGCAAGRLALPLLDYLDNKVGGSYEGFDIKKDRIDWATNNISSSYKNFRFRFLDLQSGGVDGSTLSFPYEDKSFDLIIFHSVFTHLLEPEALNYLAESTRVLSESGAIYATFFLWDPETAKSVEVNQVRWSFSIDYGTHRIVDAKEKTLAVAFDYDFLCHSLEKNDLYIEKEIRGQWRSQFSNGQDILLLRRRLS